MKRLILCCDGTWNTADQERLDRQGMKRPAPTNIVKLAYRIAKCDGDTSQIVYYGQGVGTGNSIDRITGGAFGRGLEDNIFDAYRFLVSNYQEGDKILLFGYSRGAYTARSLAGMIRKCGILKRRSVAHYPGALKLYRTRHDSPDVEVARQFRKDHALLGDRSTPIQVVGVFDTVGSLGIPLGLFRALNRRHGFHDVRLSSSIDYGFHALAIDERRGPFKPSVWMPPDESNTEQTIEQRWFCGAHGDVGGGTEELGHSDHVLRWMMGRLEASKLLAFDHTVTEQIPFRDSPLSTPIRNTKKGVYRVLRGHDREIGTAVTQADKPTKRRGRDPTQSLDPSVLERWTNDKKYRPKSLKRFFRRFGESAATG